MKTKLIGLCLMVMTSLSYGQTILIPVGSQVNKTINTTLPDKGLSQAEVVARYGEPAYQSAATGEPPISRWTYPTFSVYFEGDTVIHSVIKPQPLKTE